MTEIPGWRVAGWLALVALASGCPSGKRSNATKPDVTSNVADGGEDPLVNVRDFNPAPDDVMVTTERPDGIRLAVDKRMPFGVPVPADLEPNADTFQDLLQDGAEDWAHGVHLNAEPFGIPGELFDLATALPGPLRELTFEVMRSVGLPRRRGDPSLLPLGLGRTSDNYVVQTCSACHTGVVNGLIIPGVNNKRISQQGLFATSRNLLWAAQAFLPPWMGETRARVEQQLATLKTYEALYGRGCEKVLKPGVLSSGRIWYMSTKHLKDPSELTSRTPCGVSKAPGLTAMQFKNLHFLDGAVNSQFASVFPIFDFLNLYNNDKGKLSFANDKARLDVFFAKSRTPPVHALNAFVYWGMSTPSFATVAGHGVAAEPPPNKQGYDLFHAAGSCASCHGSHNEKGMLQSFSTRVYSVRSIGTQQERASAVPDTYFETFRTLGSAAEGGTAAPWMMIPRLEDATKANYGVGYKPLPLCSTYLNYPYLHNAAVASLDLLLRPARARAEVVMDCSVMDTDKVGCSTRAAAATPFRLAQAAGHEGPQFGTTLADPERAALLEYLRTLRCPEGYANSRTEFLRRQDQVRQSWQFRTLEALAPPPPLDPAEPPSLEDYPDLDPLNEEQPAFGQTL